MEVAAALGHEIPILGPAWAPGHLCCLWRLHYLRQGADARKQSQVRFDPDCPRFRAAPKHPLVGRYHPLTADAETLLKVLEDHRQTEDGEAMAAQHRNIRSTAHSSTRSPF